MSSENNIRVLIADDSFFIRRYLVELLKREPEIEIVGTASTGDEVVALALELKPDVITMDYHMPGKNGIEATAAIMLGEHPLPSIIMLSAFEGVDGNKVMHTLEASGAQVIRKPSGEVSLDIEKISADIVAKIKETGSVEVKIRKAYARIYRSTHRSSRAIRKERHNDALRAVVVIGASTGGPPLVEHLLSLLDPDLGVAIIIAQHMSKYFTKLFAERLDRVTPFVVREARTGDVLVPGLALVVPGGFALDFRKQNGPPGDSVSEFLLTPTETKKNEEEIDRTMEAAAQCFGSRAYGVLLSGMGTDGTRGLFAIKSHGGYTIIQDPTTATVSSMPTHALSTGIVDAVLAIESIAPHISKILESTT